jgi:hypothetical protein
MSSVCRLIATAAVVLLTTASLSAQPLPDTNRTFVDVAIGPDWDDARSASTRAPGRTWAPGVTIGFDRGRSGLELAVSVPEWHLKNWPVERFQYVGPSFAYEQQGHFYESSETARRRSIHATLLYRRNVPINGHVRLTWLVGGAQVWRHEQDTSLTKEVLPEGKLVEVNTYKRSSARNYLAAKAGVDVEVRIASRVSVVPRLRLTVFPSLLDDSGLAPRVFVARPEVAVRWSF